MVVGGCTGVNRKGPVICLCLTVGGFEERTLALWSAENDGGPDRVGLGRCPPTPVGVAPCEAEASCFTGVKQNVWVSCNYFSKISLKEKIESLLSYYEIY